MKGKSKLIQLFNVLFVLCIGFTSCQSQPQSGKTIEEQVKVLNQYAEAVTNNEGIKRKEYLILFFQSFPNDFETFDKIYGYHEDAVLHLTHTLFELLPELKQSVPADEYYKKMISIGIRGKWQADEIGILQHHLQEIVPENIKLSIDILNKKEEKEIESFWYFLFDGPHPNNYRKYYGNLYAKISQINPKIADLMKQAYEQLLSEDDGHGH